MSTLDAPPQRPHPKILAIDYYDPCIDVLRRAGYGVAEGSFGRPYKVDASDKLCIVDVGTAKLPGYTESEIVLLNTHQLAATGATPQPPGSGVEAFWMTCKRGKIDPKPLAMFQTSSDFDRIYQNGGIFIVNLTARHEETFDYGSSRSTMLHTLDQDRLSNWGFLGAMARLESQAVFGHEIKFNDEPISRLLASGAGNASYHCTIKPRYTGDYWHSLAVSKYGDDVAGYMANKQNGLVLVLPQMPEFHAAIVRLLEQFIANVAPSIFPHLEGANWMHSPAYELPKVGE
ncbi:unnamed protein product, partial [marine sediment metagenome]